MHVSITVKHYINIYPLHQHIGHFCKQTWALPGWTFCNHLREQGLETGVVRPDGDPEKFLVDYSRECGKHTHVVHDKLMVNIWLIYGKSMDNLWIINSE